jgi:hypothetical protein
MIAASTAMTTPRPLSVEAQSSATTASPTSTHAIDTHSLALTFSLRKRKAMSATKSTARYSSNSAMPTGSS